ncbi:MAG: NAD(P)-binding domain-containing protein [Actinobacteria bacterium]|nr:NAD(P)-binding domain-containing protein [Actinomycetota bacterium]
MRSFELAGIPFEAVEAHSEVGGIWDIENPGSPMYESAHFISSKYRSAYVDHPFGSDVPDYPSHRDVLAYLRGYADLHDLRRHVRFGVTVLSAEPEADGWSVTFDDGTTQSYAGLFACPGFQRVPNLPEIPGQFAGEIYHVQDYRSRNQFAGKRVLVVGGGNSGVDVACDAAIGADVARISTRRGYWIYPQYVEGLPLDFFSMNTVASQEALVEWLRSQVGDLTRFGLPEPDHLPLTHHPIVNSQILHHIGHGELEHRVDVRSFSGKTVTFVDGRDEDFDVVVLATGYRDEIPFLAPRHLRISAGPESDLFFWTFHKRYQNLFVSGVANLDDSGYYGFNSVGDMVANHILLRQADPARYRALRSVIETEHPDLTGGFEYYDRSGHLEYINGAVADAYADELFERFALETFTTCQEGATPMQQRRIAEGAHV